MWRREFLRGAGALAVLGMVAPVQAEVFNGLDISAPYAPTALRLGAGWGLRYEVHVTNFGWERLHLKSVAVRQASGVLIARWQGAALERITEQLASADVPDDLTLARGGRVIVYIDALLSGPINGALYHEVGFARADLAGASDASVAGGRVVVSEAPPPVLAAPLRGGPWVAVYAPDLAFGHRRYLYAVDGAVRIPGRFAIDWMRPGDSQQDGLGVDVLAVADAQVVSTRDGVPEPAQGAPRPRADLGDATGNFIALDIGAGRFAFYEHLMPGLLVGPGARVRRGQPLAKLGSTGQAWRPHLHFHVADANAALAAEGSPYAIAGARTIGAYESIAAFEAGGSWRAGADMPGDGAPYLPAPNAVVMFEP